MATLIGTVIGLALAAVVAVFVALQLMAVVFMVHAGWKIRQAKAR
jgi:hypothetical protein